MAMPRAHRWDCRCAACKRQAREDTEDTERRRKENAAEDLRREAFASDMKTLLSFAINPDRTEQRTWAGLGATYEVWTDEGLAVTAWNHKVPGGTLTVRGKARDLDTDAIPWLLEHARPWAEKVAASAAANANYAARVAAYRFSGMPAHWEFQNAEGYVKDLERREAAHLPLPSAEQLARAFESLGEDIDRLEQESNEHDQASGEQEERLSEAETKLAVLEAEESELVTELRGQIEALTEERDGLLVDLGRLSAVRVHGEDEP